MLKQRAGTSSALVCLLVERFLPEAQQSCVLANLKASEWCWRYNDFVPGLLRGRPRSVILHCLNRQSQSNKYQGGDLSEGGKEGVFTLQKTDETMYVVDFGRSSQEQMPSCSCKDWIRWHLPCKPFFTVFQLKQAWCWDALPQMYRDSAYLSTDNNATDAYLSSSPPHAVLMTPPSHFLIPVIEYRSLLPPIALCILLSSSKFLWRQGGRKKLEFHDIVVFHM